MLPSVLGLRAWFIFGTVVVGIGVVEVVVPFRVVVIVEVAFESMVVPLVAGVVGDEELVKFSDVVVVALAAIETGNTVVVAVVVGPAFCTSSESYENIFIRKCFQKCNTKNIITCKTFNFRISTLPCVKQPLTP